MAFHAAVLFMEALSSLNWVRFQKFTHFESFGMSACFQVSFDACVQWIICYICWTLGSSAQLRNVEY